MTSYIIRRLLMGLIVVWLVSLITFFLMHSIPGDPVLLIIGDTTYYTPEAIDEIRAQYHLNEPLIVQYGYWASNLLHGDLGNSIITSQPISTMIKYRLPITLNLAALSFSISAILGITFGTICALYRGKWQDSLLSVLANVGITLPIFWVGIVLIYFLGLKLGLLPCYGYTIPFEDFGLHIRQMILPVFCMCVFPIASLTRQTRSSMLEVIRQDYIRTARAKGLRERIVITRHMLKNGLIPVVTQLGLQAPFLIGGAVLVETVFSIPGIGRMMVHAINTSDYQVVQSGVVVIALTVVIVNIIVDITYAWLDPRIRYH